MKNYSNLNSTMESRNHFKNGVSPKNQRSRVNLFVFFLVALFFASCGTAPTEKEVTVSDVDISGTIKDFVKVVDGTYTFTNNGREAFLTVQFELIEEPYESLCIVTWEPYRKYPKLRLNAVGKNGHIFDTGVHGFEVEKEQLQKFEDLLSGKIGGKKSISFKWNYFGVNKETGTPIFKEASSFEIIEDAFVYCDHYAEMVENGMIELPNDDYEKTVTSSGSNNIDEMLNSYERYINEYIKLLKKYSNGDMSVLTQYMEMLEKAQDFAEKLSDVDGQLSASQTKRLLDLNNKFSKAIIDLAE